MGGELNVEQHLRGPFVHCVGNSQGWGSTALGLSLACFCGLMAPVTHTSVVRQSPTRAGHWGAESRATYPLLSRVRDAHTPVRSCLGMGGREKCPRCVVCPHNSWSLRTRNSDQRGLKNRCHPGCGRDESGSTGVSLACVGPCRAQPRASQWQEKERPVLDIISHWEAYEKVTLAGAQV